MTYTMTMENVHAGPLWCGHTGRCTGTGALAMAYPHILHVTYVLTTRYPMLQWVMGMGHWVCYVVGVTVLKDLVLRCVARYLKFDRVIGHDARIIDDREIPGSGGGLPS